MIIDDYVSHIDFNLNYSNNTYTEFSNYTKFYIPYQTYVNLRDNYSITLGLSTQYGFINNNRYFIILSNNFSQNANTNIFKLSNVKKDIAGNDYCVSSSLIVRAIVFDKNTQELTVNRLVNPCLPLNLNGNYLYNFYPDIKYGYGRQAFDLGTSYVDDLMYSNKSTDIITGIFYFLIPIIIVIFLIKVFRKGIH